MIRRFPPSVRLTAVFLIMSLAATGCDLCPGLPFCPAPEPAGKSFDTARLVRLDWSSSAAIAGTLTDNQPDVYDLGSCQPGDRIIVTITAAAGGSLDPTVALFNGDQHLLSYNDDIDFAAGNYNSGLDEIMSTTGPRHYLAVAKFRYDAQGGAYTGTVRIERGGVFPTPPVQYLLLNFAGGTVTLPGEGTLNLAAFDAADIDAAYAGKTAEIRARIVDIVRRAYVDTGLVVITNGDPLPPGACVYSTIYFGGYSGNKFGLAESVDQGNRNRCDDGIVFTDDFDKPFATQPSVTGIGTAIGNVAAHEAGHLLGLNHVADVIDLMDNTGTASTLLVDQVFKTSPLSPAVFPIGLQNGPLMLERVVPK